MNYETIKTICDNHDPEDLITIRVKDLKDVVMEMQKLAKFNKIRGEGEISITLLELKQIEYKKRLCDLYELISNKLDDNSLTLLKSLSLADLVEYINKDSISIRLLNCIKAYENEEYEYKRTAWNSIGDLYYYNLNIERPKRDLMGKKSRGEIEFIKLGIFKDKEPLTFGFIKDFITK